jgi:hypothetical protein
MDNRRIELATTLQELRPLNSHVYYLDYHNSTMHTGIIRRIIAGGRFTDPKTRSIVYYLSKTKLFESAFIALDGGSHRCPDRPVSEYDIHLAEAAIIALQLG